MATTTKQSDLLQQIERALLPGSVVLGVVLVLLAAMIPQCRQAAAARAEAELKAQDERLDLATRQLSDTPTSERGEALKNLREDHNQRTEELRREVMETKVAAAGAVFPLWLGWLGRVLLILGFLAMTLGASGSEQKIFAALLALVLLASLSGIQLDFGATAHLGK